MSFRPLLKALSQSAAVAGIAREALGTIDLASRVSVPKGSLRALSLSEPCISTSGVAMAAVGCAGKMGIMGGRASTILSPSPGLYHFGQNLYYYRNSWRAPVGTGTPLKVGLSGQGPTTAVTAGFDSL